MGSRSAPIGTPVVCQVHELDQQVGPHVARGPTSVLIHSMIPLRISVVTSLEADIRLLSGCDVKVE
jgi:hypothetical protein